MVKEDVETVVNTIEDIDSQIEKLTQEKEKLTKENYVDLLEHDLNTILKVQTVLSDLKTVIATKLIEDYDTLGSVEEVLSELKEEYSIKKQMVEKP